MLIFMIIQIVSLQRERWNQVEPRCAALGSAAWFQMNKRL